MSIDVWQVGCYDLLSAGRYFSLRMKLFVFKLIYQSHNKSRLALLINYILLKLSFCKIEEDIYIELHHTITANCLF
jgi:hypothetical protein